MCFGSPDLQHWECRASNKHKRPVSMEEYTGRERSPPPDPAESAAEIPVTALPHGENVSR